MCNRVTKPEPVRRNNTATGILFLTCGWIFLYLWVAFIIGFVLDSPLLDKDNLDMATVERAVAGALEGPSGVVLPALVLLMSMASFTWRVSYRGESILPLAIEFFLITGIFFFLVVPIGIVDSLLRSWVSAGLPPGGEAANVRWWHFPAFQGLCVAAVLALQTTGVLGRYFHRLIPGSPNDRGKR